MCCRLCVLRLMRVSSSGCCLMNKVLNGQRKRKLLIHNSWFENLLIATTCTQPRCPKCEGMERRNSAANGWKCLMWQRGSEMGSCGQNMQRSSALCGPIGALRKPERVGRTPLNQATIPSMNCICNIAYPLGVFFERRLQARAKNTNTSSMRWKSCSWSPSGNAQEGPRLWKDKLPEDSLDPVRPFDWNYPTKSYQEDKGNR